MAIEEGTDRLEDAARERAIDGVQKPVFYRGKVVGTRIVYSDMLLMALLNARRSERFKYSTEVAVSRSE